MNLFKDPTLTVALIALVICLVGVAAILCSANRNTGSQDERERDE